MLLLPLFTSGRNYIDALGAPKSENTDHKVTIFSIATVFPQHNILTDFSRHLRWYRGQWSAALSVVPTIGRWYTEAHES